MSPWAPHAVAAVAVVHRQAVHRTRVVRMVTPKERATDPTIRVGPRLTEECPRSAVNRVIHCLSVADARPPTKHTNSDRTRITVGFVLHPPWPMPRSPWPMLRARISRRYLSPRAASSGASHTGSISCCTPHQLPLRSVRWGASAPEPLPHLVRPFLSPPRPPWVTVCSPARAVAVAVCSGRFSAAMSR